MAFPGHHRNASQGQQLIMERCESGDEEGAEGLPTLASPCHPMSSMPAPSPSYSPPPNSVIANPGSRYKTTLPKVTGFRQYCSDSKLRDNMKVVVGSIILTLLGSALLVVGIVITLMPQDTGITLLKDVFISHLHGWIFLFAGFLFFIPGVYHVVYIICTVCGRPGYSLSNLPTFNT